MRLVLLVSALVVMMSGWSNDAWATKAKMEAFQQTLDGSDAYWDIERNVFLNPALIGRMNSFVVLEMGGDDDHTAGSTSLVGVDSASNPRAEGGFIKKGNGMHWGFYLGREEDHWVSTPLAQVNFLHSAFSAGTGTPDGRGFLPNDNMLDIFVAGGDANFAWGVDLSYSETKVTALSGDSANTQLGVLTGGAAGKNWHAALHLPILTGAKGSVTTTGSTTDATTSLPTGHSSAKRSYSVAAKDDKLEGNLGYYLVAAYNMGMGTVGFRARYLDTDQTISAVNQKWNSKESTFVLAWTSKHDMGAGSWFYSAEFFSDTIEVDAKKLNSAFKVTKLEYSALPVTIGMQQDATSWLTLRGSVRQSILLNEAGYTDGNPTTNPNNKKVTAPEVDSSSVNLGASLNFDKVRVDALLGNSSTATINASNLFSRVAAVYSF